MFSKELMACRLLKQTIGSVCWAIPWKRREHDWGCDHADNTVTSVKTLILLIILWEDVSLIGFTSNVVFWPLLAGLFTYR